MIHVAEYGKYTVQQYEWLTPVSTNSERYLLFILTIDEVIYYPVIANGWFFMLQPEFSDYVDANSSTGG